MGELTIHKLIEQELKQVGKDVGLAIQALHERFDRLAIGCEHLDVESEQWKGKGCKHKHNATSGCYLNICPFAEMK